MKIESREYKLRDFFKIPFAVSPGLFFLLVVDKIIYALIPALQVLATAGFIDTAIDIFNGRAEKAQIVTPLAWILVLIAHQYITFALMGLVRDKMNMNLTEAFRTAVTDKRAMLEYRHIENNETWDLIERVGKDPAERLGGGFDILLRMADMFLRVGSIMAVLVVQVWWAALVILAFSVPLFWLAVKSGKDNYEASKEAAKHTRRAQYLQGLLTERDNVEERTLFAYSDELNKRYYEKYVAAYKINMRAERSRFIKMKIASLITVLISVLIAGVLIAPLGSGDISVGMFMGFVTATFGLAQMMSWDLTHITSELANNREYLRDLTAFGKLSETPGAIDPPNTAVLSPGCIEFRDVSFSYPGTQTVTLKNLDLKLFAKKHYAFVGVNGAGKTTITKLLTGLYDNYTGDILIDGKNLRVFTQAELKSLFSIVYQDFAKYQISMADSIGIGSVQNMSAGAITDAINILGLDEVVSKLPEGL
ncbi:MAG: ABC transporter ATP-binding protein/permease, partial [Clostridiales Family XIII bacterium]|nr:ABC transporter ATP-binding protein/permease [Clostridiales Family XIII bacterium]